MSADVLHKQTEQLSGQEARSLDRKLALWTGSSLSGQEALSLDRKLSQRRRSPRATTIRRAVNTVEAGSVLI